MQKKLNLTNKILSLEFTVLIVGFCGSFATNNMFFYYLILASASIMIITWIIRIHYEEEVAKERNLEQEISLLKEQEENEKNNKLKEERKLLTEQAQKDYIKYNEEKYLEIKSNPEIIVILENFFPEIPLSIFLQKDYYNLFEYLITKDYEVARKTLWSSEDDILHIKELLGHINSSNNHQNKQADQSLEESISKQLSLRELREKIKENAFSSFLENYKQSEIDQALFKISNEIILFIEGDFENLKKLIQKMVKNENENDITFIALRLLQIGAASYYSQVFSKIYNINFENIDTISLQECLFIYYSSQAFLEEDIYQDPILSLFAYYLISKDKFGDITNIDYFNFLNRRAEILEMLENHKEEFDFRIFESNMTKKVKRVQRGYSIQDIDIMSGAEFEQFVSNLFEKMGYRTKVTKHSGDFGVDVIAEKDGGKIGIQAKCYAGVVPNSAIQEIVAGINHYKCDRGIVVTNSTFTKAAIELAKSNSIQLWDRKVLEEKILEIFHE